MNKKYKIILIASIIVFVVGGVLGFFVYKRSKGNNIKNLNNQVSLEEKVLNPLSGQAIGEKINVNPFEVKISPYELYNNPFKK